MWKVEPGKPDDARDAARLITETDTDLFGYCTGGNLPAWVELAEWEWCSERGIYSSRMGQVVRAEEGLLGLLVSYSSRRHQEIDWSFGCSRPHMARHVWEGIAQAYKLAAFLFPAIPDDAYYVQNVVTHPFTRGSGLGRKLMEVAFELGRSEGCRTCHLDVDGSTPAVQFYERLGMTVLVKTDVPSIPGVHTHYRMVRDL